MHSVVRDCYHLPRKNDNGHNNIHYLPTKRQHNRYELIMSSPRKRKKLDIRASRSTAPDRMWYPHYIFLLLHENIFCEYLH